MVVGYGKRIRELFGIAKTKSRKKYKCPMCSRPTVKRKASGVWVCTRCKKEFASRAYEFAE